MQVSKLFILGLIGFISVTGCVERKLKLGEERVIEKSEKRRPILFGKDRHQTAEYFYYFGLTQTVFHTPKFAYKRARKDLHNHIREDAEQMLKPIEGGLGKTTYIKTVERFVTYVSKEIMEKARKKDSVYWEKINENRGHQLVTEYRYFVGIKCQKEAFRRAEKMFLLREQKLARLKNKKLVEAVFTRSLREWEKVSLN